MIKCRYVDSPSIHQMNCEWNEWPRADAFSEVTYHVDNFVSPAALRQRRLAATLARAAFCTDAAGAGADDFVASAMRAGDVHEHVSERFGYPFGVAAAIR